MSGATLAEQAIVKYARYLDVGTRPCDAACFAADNVAGDLPNAARLEVLRAVQAYDSASLDIHATGRLRPNIPTPPWRQVPGGAIKQDGNVIHLKLDDDAEPEADLQADEVDESSKPDVPVEELAHDGTPDEPAIGALGGLPRETDPDAALNGAVATVRSSISELAGTAMRSGHSDLAKDATALIGAFDAATRKAAGMGQTRKISATPYEWVEPETIPLRPWVLGHWLLRKTAAAAIAPGGVGKSTFMAAMALSLVTGRALLGKDVHDGPQRVWLWNLEDPLDEMQRSIQATARHYDLSPADLSGRLFVDSAMEGSGLCTAVDGREGFKLVAPVYDAITAELIERKVDVLVIDPFVSSHEIDENDNSKIDAIAKAWARVANDANCVIVLVHHTSKAGAEIVTTMSARGGKALTDAVRAALVFNRMDSATAERFGLDAVEREQYFTVHDDKHNRSPRKQADWFRLASVDLRNGPGNLRPSDSVGVAVPWTPPSPMEGVGDDELHAVQQAVGGGEWRESDQSKEWVGHAVAEALDIDVGTAAGKRRVKLMLATWIREGFLTIVERKDASRHIRKFIEVGAVCDTATPSGVA